MQSNHSLKSYRSNKHFHMMLCHLLCDAMCRGPCEERNRRTLSYLNNQMIKGLGTSVFDAVVVWFGKFIAASMGIA